MRWEPNDMKFTFERGDLNAPRGHALIYFRNAQDSEDCWATYIIVLPIQVDVAKYVPPFLMSQMGEIGANDLSAFAFPPAPEQIGSYSIVEDLALVREDDVVYAGTVDPSDISSTMMRINEAIAWYAEAYTDSNDAELTALPDDDEPDETDTGFRVSEVLYELMTDGDKLAELTKLIGRLRDAVDTGDEALTVESQGEIDILAHHLPDNHQINNLVASAKITGDAGARLAYLYLQRCFHLIGEEYVKLGQVEEDIEVLEAGGAS